MAHSPDWNRAPEPGPQRQAAPEVRAPTTPEKYDCIVLAAGLSSRMGTNKLLLPVDGVPMVRRVVATAGKVCRRVVVVLGHEAEQVRIAASSATAAPIEFTKNENYRSGMFSSIQQGMRSVVSPWFFVLPGDLPFLGASVFRRLVSALSGETADAYGGLEGGVGADGDAADTVTRKPERLPVAAIPTYQGTRGHPVLFSARLVPAVVALPPDAGPMRSVLAKHKTVFVELGSPGILRDVDTAEDYRGL